MKYVNQKAVLIIISVCLIAVTTLVTISYIGFEGSETQATLVEEDVNMTEASNYTDVDITYGARESSYNVSADELVRFNNRNEVDMVLTINGSKFNITEELTVEAEDYRFIELRRDVEVGIETVNNETAPGTTLRLRD